MARGLGFSCITLLVLTACGSKGAPQTGFEGDGADAGAQTPDASGGVPTTDAGGGGDAQGPVLGGDDGGGTNGCVPVSATETKCDGKDDDCNGKIDDVDVGKDGICDCIRIGLIGKKGWYGSNNFEAWLTSKGTTVGRIQEDVADTLTDAELQPYDMVILDWLQRTYSFSEAQTFQTWMNAHHGVLALSGFAPDYDPARPNSLIGVIGLQMTSSTTFPNNMQITDFSPHPLTVGVTSVTFNGGSEVQDSPGAVAGTHTIFARSGGLPVGVAHETSSNRGVVWGDEWIEFDSEWSTVPDINRFWSNIVSYLTPRCEVPPPPK